MKKRLFSILLAQCMVLNFVPITAFAEDSTEETPECTCETTCTEETMNAECPVCGAKGALPEKCGKYVEPAAEDETSQPKGEKTQEKQNSDMPDTQSEAALAQMNGDGENGIAVQSAGVAIDDTNFPDVNFRSFVAEKYDIDGDDCLSDAEIAAVTELNCYNRGISDLTGIGHFTALTKLSCNENRLTSLDVSKNSALTYLSCYGNQLTVLDVSKNTSLTKLFCDSNQLTSLDVSKNNALNILWCNNNQLTSLDVSGNTALKHLDCKNNRLMTLNVSNRALGNLNCSNNQLTSLDLSKNYKSIDYTCDNNIYQIALDENRTFDLSTLPGSFDVSKASSWNGGSVSGNTLTVDNDKDIVTYTYDCGKGNTAYFTLQYRDADYTKVDEAITKANSLNKDEYKDFSGVEAAVKAVVRNKNITEQSEVDAMAKAIEDAIAALQYKDADYTKVDEAIAKANALKKDDYKDFSNVEAAVKAVVRGKNITEQSEVDKMAKAIEDAIADLQYKDANYDKVNEAIAKANALKKDDYKDFSGVDNAVNAVASGKNITEQSDVDAMAKAIEDAIADLQYKDANYDEVDAAITKADALNKDDYKDFSGVKAAVKAVVRDKNITEQSEVDKMAKAIEDAIADLKYKDADYTKVDAAIKKANALKKDDYKDFSGVDNAVNAVASGKNITEQSDVDAMAKAIEDAIADLQYKDANYDEVDAAITKADALNKDDYKDFSGVKAAVKAVVRDKNITEQSEVDKMAKAIEDAIADLKYKDADYTKVDAAIKKANALKKDDYKDFSGVKNAVKAVVRGKNITEQSEVDKMAKAIENAISALEKKSASAKPRTSDKNPKTGYTSNLALWIALLFISGGAAVGTMVVSRKKKYNK